MKISVYSVCVMLLGVFGGIAEEEVSSAQFYAAYKAVWPGQRVPIAVKIIVADGWHTYAKEPGDSGMPPSITLSGVDGLKVSEWRFPPPERFTDSIGTTYGYEHQVVLLSEVLIPETVSAGTVIELKADIQWMVCRDMCVFQTGSQAVFLRVEKGSSMEPSSEWRRLLEKSCWTARSGENE